MGMERKRYVKPDIRVVAFNVEKGFALSGSQEISIREAAEEDIITVNGYSHHVASSFDRHSSSEYGWDI